MGRLRRFVLVATITSGLLLWIALAVHATGQRWIPVGGLIAAIISAAMPWAPRFATTAIARVVLAGLVSLGLLALLAVAASDYDVGITNNSWVMIFSWLGITGVVAQLVVREVEPRHVFWGLVLVFGSVLPFIATRAAKARGPVEFVVYGFVGLMVLGLVPLFTAKITRAIFGQRLETPPAAELPDARSL